MDIPGELIELIIRSSDIDVLYSWRFVNHKYNRISMNYIMDISNHVYTEAWFVDNNGNDKRCSVIRDGKKLSFRVRSYWDIIAFEATIGIRPIYYEELQNAIFKRRNFILDPYDDIDIDMFRSEHKNNTRDVMRSIYERSEEYEYYKEQCENDYRAHFEIERIPNYSDSDYE